jgi:hypothetical protein
LDANVTDQDLRQVFGQYGELISVKIPVGKGCGFVQFSQRSVLKPDGCICFWIGILPSSVPTEKRFHTFLLMFSALYFRLIFKLMYRAAAEEAIQKLHGTSIGQQTVRLSWGRSPANKQVELLALVGVSLYSLLLS